MTTKARNTIDYLKECQAAREAGYPVYLKTDPAWLVDMAVNRRAGCIEDPHFHGAVLGFEKLPRKAQGDAQRHLANIARAVNTPRLIVRPQELGEFKALIEKRIPERLFRD